MGIRRIYRKIAKQYGVTPAEVKREINMAITRTWANAGEGLAIKQRQEQIPCKGKIPTDQELIEYLAQKIRTGKDS